MTDRRIVTVVGATGAQGGAVVRSLIETGKYKIRALTRDPSSEKSQAVKRLSDDIDMVMYDINRSDDVQRAFKDSWAIYAVTDSWEHPDQLKLEMQQGRRMADIAASLNPIPYFIFSALEDVPHFSQKSRLRDYIKRQHPDLKAIFVEPGFYMQNWQTLFKPTKSDDGTLVFTAPIDSQTKLHLLDIEDIGTVVREILTNPETFIGQDICICGDAIRFADISKVFTKVTGKAAISKTINEEEFRSVLYQMPTVAQDDLADSYEWFEEYSNYGKDKDWTTGQKLWKLKTFEDWLKQTGWQGD
ncbi:unnamed protein product [Rotaria sp. Silwood2]|nr:unnamed protein product [Rotaria sp. Silwood2]CAF3140319.1 unnamed protein product [Rotaria sp. Silwood2]CAF3330410.1 unnamed protein product [Rotaria sp. Silwood2]CAF4301919.1 unnamed protein product [Rotaria sp. Silwood2]CAF4404380.1 unnamed protein product [Rotaria sp. Silwood2]